MTLFYSNVRQHSCLKVWSSHSDDFLNVASLRSTSTPDIKAMLTFFMSENFFYSVYEITQTNKRLVLATPLHAAQYCEVAFHEAPASGNTFEKFPCKNL